MAKITVDELIVQAGIEGITLDQQCHSDDFLSLYELCDPWELIGQHLKLTQSQISAVDGDYKTTDQNVWDSCRNGRRSLPIRLPIGF